MEPELFPTSTPSCLLEWVYKLVVSGPGSPQLTLFFPSPYVYGAPAESRSGLFLGAARVDRGWGTGEAPPQHPHLTRG